MRTFLIALALLCATGAQAATLKTETVSLADVTLENDQAFSGIDEETQITNAVLGIPSFGALFFDDLIRGAVLERVVIDFTLSVEASLTINTSRFGVFGLGSLSSTGRLSLLGRTAARVLDPISLSCGPIFLCSASDDTTISSRTRFTFTSAADLTALAGGQAMDLTLVNFTSAGPDTNVRSEVALLVRDVTATYTYRLPDPAPIPLPAGLPLGLTALGALACMARRGPG